MIDILLSQKINVNARDEYQKTALFFLCEYRENPEPEKILANLQKLMAAGAQINIFNSYGETPLFNSLGYCDNKIALALISKGAKPLLKEFDSTQTSFSKALRFKFSAVVEACLDTFDRDDIRLARSISELYGNPLKDRLNALELKITLEHGLQPKPGGSKRKI